MNRLLFPFIIILTTINIARAQKDLSYYLPQTLTYNAAIPTPKQFTGHETGEYHLTHDKLYYYMLELARISDRAVWEEYGRSHEGRPLGQLIISSPVNIKNLEILRLEHLELCDPIISSGKDIKSMPVFIKLGYGIHGNESSAQNSSVLIAYYLVAGQGKDIDELLSKAVILIDPSLNPDGMQRHSTWVNSTRSYVNNPDPASWEFSETWPGGRTNHYWFDLNRDYLMLQHPESTGRVAAFHKWKPNINTDHHETGPNETFFFQPGIQSRNNPLTPSDNQVLTAEIARYHEKYLNAIGSLYFTEESFDDFYIGKGSSYPDIHGSVGILFEQGGTKGHLRETDRGLLSFPFAIKNHFTVSLSTLEAGLKMKDRLLESQRFFYRNALEVADRHNVKAYVFTETEDQGRINEFIRILLSHQIKVYSLAKDINRNDILLKAAKSFIVPLKQTEHLFIRSLFEPVKEFTDSTFYDTSTWILPMAFNINYTGISLAKEMDGLLGDELTHPKTAEGKLVGSEAPYAYLFEWNQYLSPRALFSLQDAGLTAMVATDKFVCNDGEIDKTFSYGTIMIPVSGQPLSANDLHKLMQKTASENGITIYCPVTGLTTEGIDLGSVRLPVISKPSVMMIAGDGTSSADAGEIWHLLDRKFNIPVTITTAQQIRSVKLERYSVIIVAGSPDINSTGIEDLKTWNRKGGTLIGYKNGNSWLNINEFAKIEYIPSETILKKEGIYIDRNADNRARQIPGSIFETTLDLTHPLCYGYNRDHLPVFKTTSTTAKTNPDIYNNPVRYTQDPLLSGYCSQKNVERIKGAAFASVHGNRIISIYDNTNFRAFWYGTEKIFLNAVFFGQILR